jgi:3-hydroxy-9,10-secoandrosta-1,3,5(10)-triene-9,17-dione monooxygenase
MTASSPPPVAPPEPDLTPEQLIARAAALRPMLLERQAEVEERTYYAEDVHREIERAGIYRTFIPRRYGGYEFDVGTFARIGIELGRGCPSSAWCCLLASNHALLVGSFFGERTQEEVFSGGDFRAPAVTAPVGVAKRTADGWELTGSVAYCSGSPYSTHYLGQSLTPGETRGGPPGPQLLFIAPRSEWEMVEGSWGDLLGLKGSGSHTLRFEGGRVPSHYVLEDTLMVDVDVSDPARVPGVALHGNPMYGGRTMGIFTITLAAVMVGAALGALDDYERQLHEKNTALPPFVPRREDPDYQRWFGSGMAKIATAEAALLGACDQHMAHCRAAAAGVPYTWGADMLVGCIAREVMVMAWETMQSEIFRTSGSSAARHGERIERIYRDLSMGNSHRNVLLRDLSYREIARARLGLPKAMGQQRTTSARTSGQR